MRFSFALDFSYLLNQFSELTPHQSLCLNVKKAHFHSGNGMRSRQREYQPPGLLAPPFEHSLTDLLVNVLQGGNPVVHIGPAAILGFG